jgi:hypothetical protein
VELSRVLSNVQASRIAMTIGGSTLLSGLVSGLHLLGLTLLVGGSLVSSLRLLGILFPERPVNDVTAATDRGMTLGLTISIATGLLLFSPRAVATVSNRLFQIKMLVLLTAAGFHFGVRRRVTRRPDAGPQLLRFTGACGLALWFGVALAGCAFILLE